MSSENVVIALLLIASLLIAFCWAWLWFMIKHKEKWNAIVDKENAFWLRVGVSASLAERFTKSEKGRFFKIIVGLTALIFTLAFIITVIIEP